MALPITLIPQNLDPNVCYANEQLRLNDFVQHTQGSIPDGFTPVVVSPTAPGPDQRTFLWAKVDGNNAIQDLLTFSNGAWNGLPKPWIPGEFKEYDPSFYTPVAPWFPCDGSVAGVPDRRGRSSICTGQRTLPVGSPDTATNFIYGATGGEEKHPLTSSENGPHAHSSIAPATCFWTYQGAHIQTSIGTGSGATSLDPLTESSGLGNGHNTLHPYFAVAIMQWRPDLV